MRRYPDWIALGLAAVILVSGVYVAAANQSPPTDPHGGHPIPAGVALPTVTGPFEGLVKYNLTAEPQRVAYDPTTGEAFVSTYGRLEVLNTSNGSVAGSITTAGSAPQHSADYPVVYDPRDGMVYEGIYGNATIEYVYPSNLTHGTIPVYGADYAMQLLYDPIAGKVMVMGPAGHGFWTLDGLTATNTTTQFGVAANATLGDLYAAYFGAAGMVYVASANAIASGHPVWGLNASTLSEVSYTVVPLTWQWGDFIPGNGTEVGVSYEGYFSAVNLTSGKETNWTWTASSVGSPYYSLAYSPASKTFALASKHDYVRLFSLTNGTVWEADVSGAVPQVGYLGGAINEFAASSWNPPQSPGIALFLISTAGKVQSVTTGMDTFSLTVVGNTVWIGGSQYGSYPDADAIESYTISAQTREVVWSIIGQLPQFGWGITVGGVNHPAPNGNRSLTVEVTSSYAYNWTATAKDYRLSPSEGMIPATNKTSALFINLTAILSRPIDLAQSGGNASGAYLTWVTPPGTVNVTLLEGAQSGNGGCSVVSMVSIGNVSSGLDAASGFAASSGCAAVETWNSSGVSGQTPFINTTEILPDMTYFQLPGWNNLSAYAFDNACASNATCDAQHPAGGVQQPLISWTSEGVYYVNVTNQLVYYSFLNRSVTHHWPWIPLYQQIMTYPGIENTEWITPNGEWIYTFGTISQGGTTITFYGVNISSGKAAEHNFSGPYSLSSGLSKNIQVNVIGIDGEYNTVAMLWAPGPSFVLWSLVNGSQWVAGNGAMFGHLGTAGIEANNIYWVPELNSLIEIYADGVPTSGWTQFLWNGSGFENISWGLIPSLSNGVQGLFFNLTSHRLYSDVQASPTTQYTFFWDINGTALGSIHLVSRSIEVTAPVHRMMESAGGEAVGGDNVPGYNDGTGHWATAFTANGSVEAASPYTMLGSWTWTPQSLEGLGFDSSYQLYPLLSDCYRNPCAISGTNANWSGAGNVALVGADSFPAGAPLVLGPPAPPLLTVKLTAYTANLSWSEPASSEALNYTIWWGVAGKPFTHSVSLLPTNNSYTIAGLNSSTHYEFEVIAHNLDWYGNGSISGQTANTYSVTFKESGLPVGKSWSITWNGANYTSQNETLALSATNGSYSWDIPAEGSLTPSPSAGITNVSGTGVSITVTFSSWSPPATPNSISSSVVGSTYAILQWGAIAGARNYSISEGGTCSSLGASQSLGNVLQDNLSGLTPGTGYCIGIRAWNGTVGVNLTDDTQIFTGAPVVASVNAESIDVDVNWQNPTGEPAVVVDAVYLYAADGSYLGSSGTGGPATSIILAGLKYSTTYSVRIKAEYSGGGSSMLSAPVSFQTPGCTQGCAASAQPGLLGWLSVPINAAILVGFGASAVLGAAAATLLRGPKKRRR